MKRKSTFFEASQRVRIVEAHTIESWKITLEWQTETYDEDCMSALISPII